MTKIGPRLIIGGASKSGTTAIYYYLRQHPSFCLSEKKELHYFSRPSLAQAMFGPGDRFILAEIPGTFDEYLSFFNHCGDKAVAVDISPSYLFHFKAADEIKRHLGIVRIVFILRNPVDKAFSQYMHLFGEGLEKLSFEEALQKELERKERGYSDMWLYKSSGYYAKALAHYVQVFGRENIRTYYYEELLNAPHSVLKDICTLAGADPLFQFEAVSEVNRSGNPKSMLLAKLLGPNVVTYLLRRIIPRNMGRSLRKVVKELNTGARLTMNPHIREMLLSDYRDDIRQVEELAGHSSGWLPKSSNPNT